MPSTLSPFGFQLVRSGSGPAPLRRVLIPSGDSGVYGKGDVVVNAGDAGSVGGGPECITVARTTANGAHMGVIVGFEKELVSSGMNLNTTHRPASTAMYALIRPILPDDVYRVQCDGALTTADVGLNADITGNGGGTTITNADTTTGMSTMMLDTSTAQTTSTLSLRILGADTRPGNDVTDTYPNVLVSFNKSNLPGGAGTAGV